MKVELIRSLVPLGLMHIEELFDEEVTALAGERYARKAPSSRAATPTYVEPLKRVRKRSHVSYLRILCSRVEASNRLRIECL